MNDLDIELRGKLQPKQDLLLEAIMDRRPNAPRVIGFGGARGAAKSYAARNLALGLALEQPGIIVWLIRRVWDDLNKDHVKPLFLEYPELKQYWHAVDHELRLPVEGGESSIFFIHAGDSGRSKRKARGPQAHYIFLEQAEEFSEEEIQQLDGSNRAAGTSPGFCKKILTFNPGGIGTAYLRRVMWMKDFHDNESPEDFFFIQAFGWDNYEWFRGLGTVTWDQFYYEWPEEKRFQVFIEETGFGKGLNRLPPAQRIGELMGSFERFAGQYYAEVWEPSVLVLRPEIAGQIIQPWWRRWLSSDWGFSHYAANGWFSAGMLAPKDALGYFGIEITAPVRIIILYRELICNDVEEPLLAQLITTQTPPAERREVRDHWMGPDAWAKRGSAHTVVEQMEPILRRDGMPPLSKADTDRVGGWRLMYNCWASARRFRKWTGPGPFVQLPEDQPLFFISGACAETIQAIPMLMCKEDDPLDVEKMAGKVEDDCADMVRYGLKSYLAAAPVPESVTALETYHAYKDPTARAMAMLHLKAKERDRRFISRRRMV